MQGDVHEDVIGMVHVQSSRYLCGLYWFIPIVLHFLISLGAM